MNVYLSNQCGDSGKEKLPESEADLKLGDYDGRSEGFRGCLFFNGSGEAGRRSNWLPKFLSECG